MDEMTDQELLHKYYDSGDMEALGKLYKRHAHLVFGLCMKYLKNETLSEDATMEIFELLIKYLKKNIPEHFKSWLYIVSKNHCLKILKKEAKRNTESENLMENFVDFEQNETLIDEQLNKLDDHMKKLPDKQQKALKLFYYRKLTYKEISDHMDCSLTQTKSNIQNGKIALKKALKI